MKKIRLLVIVIFSLTISCDNSEETTSPPIDEIIFNGYVIEPDKNERQTCADLFLYSVENKKPYGTCLSGPTDITKKNKYYLYQYATRHLIENIKWEVSENIEILHTELFKGKHFTVSTSVIMFKDNFNEGFIKAYNEDPSGSLAQIPVIFK